MNINRTCKITLTPAEVTEALSEYIRVQNKYREHTTHIKSYEEVLSYEVTSGIGEITVSWGEAPEPEEVEKDEVKGGEQPAFHAGMPGTAERPLTV